MPSSSLNFLVGNLYVCSACIFMLWFIIYLNHRHLFNHGGKTGTGYIVLWCVFTLYSVFYCPPGGDNFNALNTYNSYFIGVKWEYLHYEKIHFKIMDMAPWGYFSWRFLLWGIMGATAFIFLCKSLRLDKHLATIACCTFALPVLFYYQRAAVGYSLLYISIVYLVLWYQNKSTKLLAISILSLLSALPFHNAMIFYVVVAYFSLICPLNNKTLFLLLIGAIFINFTLLETITYFLEQTSQDTTKTAMWYVEENEVRSSNFWGMLNNILSKGPIFLMVLYCLTKYLKFPAKFTIFEKTFLLNVIILLVFSTLLSSTSYAISAKFEKMAYLPLTLFFASYFKRYRNSKACKIFVFSLLGSIIIIQGFYIIRGVFWFE